MTLYDREYQAAAFLDWYGKVGGDFDAQFLRWAATKEFMRRDELSIRTIAVEEHFARAGVSVDPLDFLRLRPTA